MTTGLEGALTVFDGREGHVEFQFGKCCETGVRTGSINYVTVFCVNRGDTDAPAQLLGMDMDGGLFGVRDEFGRRRFTTSKLRWLGIAKEVSAYPG